MSASRRMGLLWAVAGGVVLTAGVIAIIIASLSNQPTPPRPTDSTIPPTTAPSSPPVDRPGAVVDAGVVESGWLPEPITTDPEPYVRAALAAASTFDTTVSSRDEWLAYLDSWFTPDTRYDEADRDARLDAAQRELRQGVVFPQEQWDGLAAQDGRVSAAAAGDVVLSAVPEDASGDMRIGTADVELTFTQSDGTGNESSYTESVRVSVQVLCGPGSIPVPDSAQRPGDCKVIRYFTEPVED